jgi:hypothetical protein
MEKITTFILMYVGMLLFVGSLMVLFHVNVIQDSVLRQMN